MKQKLSIDKNKALIFGVCAGIAKHLNADITMVRVVCLILIFLTGLIPGLILYVIIAIVMPDKKEK